MTASEFDKSPFVGRHIGPRNSEISQMLEYLAQPSLDSLVHATIPAGILASVPLQLPDGSDEADILRELRGYADRNQVRKSLIGMGYYGTFTPPVIQRNILENPAWYTSYTPYQAEISQGRLEALLNFQTMISDLTGLEVANASLLDEATAAAEAMTLAYRANSRSGRTFLVDANCHPQTIAVLQTRSRPLGIDLKIISVDGYSCGEDAFAVLIQYPGTFGRIPDLRAIAHQAHDSDQLLIAAADPLSLILLEAPGKLGADISVGSTQRFGVPMGFGGPHAAFIAVRDGLKRYLPGRLVGVSSDADNRPALRLALQTREQHIRREKATSNVCTAQALLAVMAGMYAVYHGSCGLVAIAEHVNKMARMAARGIQASGYRLLHDAFFDTITVEAPSKAKSIVAAAAARGLNLRVIDPDRVGMSFDETTKTADVEALLAAFGCAVSGLSDDLPLGPSIPESFRRADAPLQQPIFNTYHSETEFLRYARRLSDKDIALDRAMIPLGSCTMKLNGTTEMMPVTWPEFADLHPFAPAEQTGGTRQLIADLEGMLAEITGYDAVSLQPNAGSQGEFAGLMAVRGYYEERQEEHRNICLIPASAHGTNPASATMAGMQVIVVECDRSGNIDLEDLHRKAREHQDRLAVAMITYPSTHGVFEEGILEACEIVHRYGGQVYVDGANLNAMVGYAKPGSFGADVSHLNLHKTFCIPHGGGGPGVGPVAVKKHLTPFLPRHPLGGISDGEKKGGAVSAAPFGSAGILPISWAYIRLMGPNGLKKATAVAILSANYIARRLADYYPLLYVGKNGLVAHECILDLRPLRDRCGVTVDDVAKRLIDYGFHAPTMSFPVPGTLMIEPTESESLVELDRFCDALIEIRNEVQQVENGEVTLESSVLRHAPHPASVLLSENWTRPYSRMLAAFPRGVDPSVKYWPPVSRIDNVSGDRNLICSCPSIDEIRRAAQ